MNTLSFLYTPVSLDLSYVAEEKALLTGPSVRKWGNWSKNPKLPPGSEVPNPYENSILINKMLWNS